MFTAVVHLTENLTDGVQGHNAKVEARESSGLRPRLAKESYECNVCGQLFARPSMLERHRHAHETGHDSAQSGGPVTDSVQMNGECLSQSSTQQMSDSSLVQQEKSGTCSSGGKAYVCGLCGANFDVESDVHSHMFSRHICKYMRNSETHHSPVRAPGL